MPSIHEKVRIEASAGAVWAAVRDFGALPDLVPGFVTATTVEPSEPAARVVTFASGLVLREVIVAIDEARRRLVWAIDSPNVRHHNGALEITPDGEGCVAQWTADVLPDALVAQFQPAMAGGLQAMKRRFEKS